MKIRLLCIAVFTLMVQSTRAFSQEYDLNQLIETKGSAHGVSPNLIRAVMSTESALRRTAVSPKGAQGLMQLMPATAELMGVPRSQLFDPERNIEAGTRYLAKLQGLFGSNVSLIAAAYNAGEGAVQRFGGIPPYRETQNYVPQVVGKYNLFNSCGVSCFNNMHKGRASVGSDAPMMATAQPAQKTTLMSWLGGGAKAQQVDYRQNPSMNTSTVSVAQPIAVRVRATKVRAVGYRPPVRQNGFVQVLTQDGTYQAFQ